MAERATRNRMKRALAAIGFKRDWADKSCAEYSCAANNRSVRVQIWNDGMCRACAAFLQNIGGNLCPHETTLPTMFETVPEMHAAIRNEFTRPLPEWNLICSLPDMPTPRMVLWNPCDGVHLVSFVNTPGEMEMLRTGRIYTHWRELEGPK